MLRALTKSAGLITMMAGLLFIVNAPAALAQAAGDGCGVKADMSASQRTQVSNIATSANPATSFSCQNVSSLSASQKTEKCVRQLCPQYTSGNVLCCLPNVGTAPGTADNTGGASGGNGTTGQSGGVGRLALPSCVADGSCQLDDIVTMAVNVAKFLFGISGAIFLLVFVVNGFRFIFFASDVKTSGEVKSSLVKAATGMVIIALAGVATTYVYDSLRRGSAAGANSGAAATTPTPATTQPTDAVVAP